MEQRKKIFIVDDDNFLLDMYALQFSKSNFSVETALGPKIALKKLQEGLSPDIILLDIVMPVMNGFELMEKMKEKKLAQGAHIITLSNRGQLSDVARGKALGAVGYIIKASSTPGEIIEKVNDIINNKDKKS